jgi:hypothetical protein
VATFVERLTVPVAVVGGLWAVGYSAGFASWTQSELGRAAVIQEMFDVRLFGLPWNAIAAGNPVGAQEVSWLASRYHGSESELHDYYEVPQLPHPYDVIACQLQNLAWGARVRRRYARVLLATIIVWLLAGFAVGAIGGLTVTEIALRWYVPSLGALLLAWDSFRAQREVAIERERILGILWDRVRASAEVSTTRTRAELVDLARSVQDAIQQTRRRNIRVPNWFFTRFQAMDRQDFKAIMVDLVVVLDGAATTPR